jgi:hypothetical protein
MVTGAAENGQGAQLKTKQFNVTDLTLRQKSRLFVFCFNEGNFVGFDKRKVGGPNVLCFHLQELKENK